MAKSVNDVVLDAVCTYFKANGNKISVCEGEPTTYEHANSVKGTATGKVLVSDSLATGDYTAGNGDVSGRRTTISAKSSLTVSASGTGNYVAIVDTTNTRLLYVTTCKSVIMRSGLSANIEAWDIEILDPA